MEQFVYLLAEKIEEGIEEQWGFRIASEDLKEGLYELYESALGFNYFWKENECWGVALIIYFWWRIGEILLYGLPLSTKIDIPKVIDYLVKF